MLDGPHQRTYLVTSVWLGDLSEVHLVIAMCITQSILVSIRLVAPEACTILCDLFQSLERPIPLDFYIDADSAVQVALGKREVQISDLGFDDLRNHFPSSVCRHPHRRVPSLPQQVPQKRRKVFLGTRRQSVELVNLSGVDVVNRYTRDGGGLVLWILRAGIGNERVQVVVEVLVLSLRKVC